jgi:hypothetical protein
MDKTTRKTVPLLLGLAVGAATVQGGMDVWGEQKNRAGLSIRPAFNIKANFSNLGGAPPRTDIGPAASRENHDYDDGYNRVDSTGNADGTTWYWGYELPSQALEDGMVSMSSTYAEQGGAISEVTDDPHWGGELTYMREIGWNNSYWYGLVVGLSWHELRFSQDQSFSYAAVRITDTYVLPGDLPAAPHRGQFEDIDGPELGDTPARSSAPVPGGATTIGTYDYEASAYTLRAGLLFETPFSDSLDLQFGGGVLGTMIDGRFSFRETTVVTSLQPYSTSADQSSTSFAGGGYAEVNLALRVSKGVYAFAGAQYLILTDISQTAAGRKVQLDAKNGIVATAGMNFAF